MVKMIILFSLLTTESSENSLCSVRGWGGGGGVINLLLFSKSVKCDYISGIHTQKLMSVVSY